MPAVTTRRAGLREWSGLALLALPTALLGLDVTVLYLVLPTLSADLAPSATQELWIVDAYGFFIAGFLITMGNLGDQVGRRRLLMIGIAGFAVASVLAAFAPSAGALILARALLGIAGATLMPSTLSLISVLFTHVDQRAVAIGVWATMFALGMAAGPVVGGAIVAHWWWGAAFLVAIPVAILVLAGGRALLPEYVAPPQPRLDLRSVVLSLTAILPLIYAIKHASGSGGADARLLLALMVGGVSGIVFVRRQIKLPSPLLDLTLFRDRSFSVALAVLLVGLLGVGGAMFLVTQYLQLVVGLAPAVAGLWMGPPALAMLFAAIAAPVVARRVRPGVVMAATLGASLIGYLLLAVAGTEDTMQVVTGFAFIYLGLGAIAALGTDIVVGAAPRSRSGSAAAMSETVQELGIAAGVAVLGSLTLAVYRGGIDLPDETEPGVAAAVQESLGSALNVSSQVPAEVITAAQEAFARGLNTAAAVAGVAITAVVVLCAGALGHVRPIGESER